MENENRDLQTATDKLKTDTENIVLDILNSNDAIKTKDLTQLFNLAQLKKQVVRSAAYNSILDNVTEQIQKRVENNADCFSNKDLIDYVKTISDSLEKTQKQITDVDTSPAITINQQNNTVVVGETELSRESRENVLEAVNAFLARIKRESENKVIGEELTEETVPLEENNDEIEISTTPSLEENENHAE